MINVFKYNGIYYNIILNIVTQNRRFPMKCFQFQAKGGNRIDSGCINQDKSNDDKNSANCMLSL